MHYRIVENPNHPTLVCVPGLMGGPEDFFGIKAAIQSKFQVIYVDPNQARKEVGLSNLSLEETKAVSFDTSASEIKEILTGHKIANAYFLGVSLGGKIVYDFAIRYPGSFLGGVISDVGPASFMESDLATLVTGIVDQTNLNLTWDEVKKHLKETIPDRNLRSLLQSQISYPNQIPPGIWKTGMRGLRTLLQNNLIDDQVVAFSEANLELLRLNRKITVLVASHHGGITRAGVEQMKAWRSLELIDIPNSAHFLHVTHKEELQSAVLSLLKSDGLPSY